MNLFGKDPEYSEVVAADFLPDGENLFILVSDSDCNVNVLQYDPEGAFPFPLLLFFLKEPRTNNLIWIKQTPNHRMATDY